MRAGPAGASRVRSWPTAAVALLAACGRLGYDPLPAGAEDGGADSAGPPLDAVGDGDAAPATDGPAPWIVSVTRITANDGYSLVDLAVDWPRRLAYASSRQADECLLIVDFGDERAPARIADLAPGQPYATAGVTCLGVALWDGGRRLVLSSQSSSGVEAWDLGADPRTLSFLRTAVAASDRPCRLRVRDDGVGGALVAWARGGAGGGGAFETATISPAGQIGNRKAWADACSNNYVVALAGQVAGGCWEDLSPISVLDEATFGTTATIDMSAPGPTGLWSGAVDPGGRWSFHGGWVSAFVDHATSPPSLLSRFDNDEVYRAATALSDGGGTTLYTVTAGGRVVEVWDATDPGAPRLVRRADLPGTEGETYGVSVDPGSRRAAVVTNAGDFVLIDLSAIPATTIVWPRF